MQDIKKIILGLIRSISRLFRIEGFIEKRMESVWRFMHRREVIVNLEADVESLKKDIESMGREKESMNREKESLIQTIKSHEKEKNKLLETVKLIRGEHEGKTDEFLDRERILPGILFNTMPKSGSVYIARTLAGSLDIEYREIKVAHGFFPRYFVMPNALERVARGNVIRQEHLDASPVNIKHLARFIDRLVVQVRDPRQATLSWLHHTNRILKEHPDGTNYTSHTEPDGYTKWPLDRQLDWHIDTQLRSLVEWLEEWTAYANGDGELKVLFTRYEDLITDEAGLFEQILEFFEIPRTAFNFTPAEKTIDNNFRKGKADEWLGVYTDKQKKRSEKMIGPDLLKRFGWE